MTTPLPLIVYPNMAAASTTLATANALYANPPLLAGIAQKTSLVGTATGFGEIWSQGNAGAWAAGALNLNIAPTGHGWMLDGTLLDNMLILDGLWTAQPRGKVNANTATVDLYYRAFIYDSIAKTYTLIGIMSKIGCSYTTTDTSYGFTALELPIAGFRPGLKLYFDLWGNITASTMVAGNTIAVSTSNSVGGGSTVVFVQTPDYIAAPTPRYIPRALGGTIIPDPVSQPLPYIDRGILSTVVYENRTFVPRALGGVYIPDTSLWVPRGIGSTIQVVPLARTLAGVGTLAGTVSLTTALSTTFVGVGTLTPTLSAALSLPIVTLAGVGTLAGTLSLSTALTVTLAGVGTLGATLSTTGSVSLSGTLAGVGTLAGTLSANTALSSTLAGVGTLAGTLSLTTALASTLVGVGTLSGTFSLRVALALTFAGIGTFSGTLSLPAAALLYLSATCVTRDMQATAKTRDMIASAITRDERATANARDEQTTAKTRDMQARAKTRS